ncbi:ABC transporter ATP-binding protein [Plastoroseomonas arctica]|uniref:ABC transporter ATP-binding protein n=1 Tax=Plastoroseomonas arctica TaxID=1509237 RepID=A0AAF1JX69_9PROT|nr:ABC transporter ATP-binding protein [Plastoroseomonas arctica]MBR0655927.1 ABC transporter ATP-binding protein [Plastoroseomonas arctica]
MPEAPVLAQLDLELRNLRKRFGSFVAVDGVSLQIAKGQFVCLLGPSGCGKTTTLRCIAGLEEPDDGDILIGGREVTRDAPWQRDIAMMFQDFALFPHMSVAKQVGFGLEMLKRPKAEVARRVAEVLKAFEITPFADRKPASLSGGQKQRVALARAMITEPRLLLLDEPIGALDYSLRETVMIELKALQRRTGISFIWVTHDQNEAFSLGDHVVVMNHAKIEQQGSPEDILQRPRTPFVAGFVQGNNVFRGTIAGMVRDQALVRTALGEFEVPLLGAVPTLGSAASFSVRAERLRPTPEAAWHNRMTLTCQTVEYFGSVRRYILARPDGEVIKLDQFGAEPAYLRVGEEAVLGWRTEDGMLHEGAPA